VEKFDVENIIKPTNPIPIYFDVLGTKPQFLADFYTNNSVNDYEKPFFYSFKYCKYIVL